MGLRMMVCLAFAGKTESLFVFVTLGSQVCDPQWNFLVVWQVEEHHFPKEH